MKVCDQPPATAGGSDSSTVKNYSEASGSFFAFFSEDSPEVSGLAVCFVFFGRRLPNVPR